MHRPLAFLALSSLVFVPQGNAAECDQVVTDTVAEMRAGAAGWWSEDVAQLVRAAAGSACVKALSGRYEAAAAAAAPVASDLSSEPSGEDRVVAETAIEAEAEAASGDEAPADADSEEGFSFGGLTFRSLSGSPSKKPYERTRDKNVKDDEGR